MSLPKVAYFSMEMAIDQSLYTYSGGLGYLAGSHMHSAGYLNLPMVGVTILWSHGYGDQVIREDNTVDIEYTKREFPFLKDTGIEVEIFIFGEAVKIKALKLEPTQFGTIPIYFLTTDIPENSDELRKLTNKLYDGNERVRIAQEMILGIGGVRVLHAAHESINVFHMNEGHALPAAFELLHEFGGNLQKVKDHLVFTTHTPVAAGNETHNVHTLAEAGFFGATSVETAVQLGGEEFSLTVAALRMSRIANGVSQLHGQVANNMWSWVQDRCPIIAITNAVDIRFWQEPGFHNANRDSDLFTLKRQMKVNLIDYIRESTGKELDPDVLTVVWARRFTAYKRPNLIFDDYERIKKLLDTKKVQLVFAGKFHPKDETGRDAFNQILGYAKELPTVAVLPGYDLGLSKLLKCGADVWLNTPTRPMEASGTSGMSANMNGAIHVSTFDGWAVEGTYHNINGYIINEECGEEFMPPEDRRVMDYNHMMELLENDIIPAYYDNESKWADLMHHAIRTAEAYFNSDRMAIEYFIRMYKPICL